MVKSLEEHLSLAQKEIKPAKSSNLSVRKLQRNNKHLLLNRLPLLVEGLLRRLDREASTGKHIYSMSTAVTAQHQDGLQKIDQCFLPGKFKVGECY